MAMIQIFTAKEKEELVGAVQSIRQTILWKKGKGQTHLAKRRNMGHISPTASLDDYEMIISQLVSGNNVLYLYEFSERHFYAVRGFFEDKEWLVIYGIGGLMETAFPPDDIDDYLCRRGFVLIGPLEEVLKWT